MHHVVLDRWSRGRSVVHSRDARAKILAVAAFLVIVATTPMRSPAPLLAYAAILLPAALLARLPLFSLLLRASAVLPFAAAFAAMSILGGEAARAAELLQKSYLSALGALLLAGTTPMPDLLRGMESLGAPRYVLLVVQFLYRYLFVISEQAQHMRLAAASRGSRSGFARRRRWSEAAVGAVAVLFARSYARAEGIHRAMLARGYTGHLALLSPARFGWADGVFLLLAVLAPVAARLLVGDWN